MKVKGLRGLQWACSFLSERRIRGGWKGQSADSASSHLIPAERSPPSANTRPEPNPISMIQEEMSVSKVKAAKTEGQVKMKRMRSLCERRFFFQSILNS